MALIPQAVIHQLKSKLLGKYKQCTAAHLAQQVLTNTEGDIRVEGVTNIITYYRDHEKLNHKQHFKNLPQILQSEGINPKNPWLFNFKPGFRCK